MKSRQHQSGLSAIAILLVVLVAIFFGTCAIKLGPEYIESFTVKNAVEGVIEQARNGEVTTDQIKGTLARFLDVNRIEVINAKDVKVTRKDGKVVVDASYEKRIPLMFNIDVVLKFDKLVYEL